MPQLPVPFECQGMQCCLQHEELLYRTSAAALCAFIASSSAASRTITDCPNITPNKAASCSMSSISLWRYSKLSGSKSVRFMSLFIIDEAIELNSESSSLDFGGGGTLAMPNATPSSSSSPLGKEHGSGGKLATSSSSRLISTVQSVNCEKSLNRLETPICISSMLSRTRCGKFGHCLQILPTKSFGLNSSHLSGGISVPRNKTNVGVPRATGHWSGKSFFSMFNLLICNGTPEVLSNLAREFTKGRIKKQSMHVSSYI
mmetsp:Transcript_126683/g.354634  ORF Transcript_126683/g.354634 Transcript_126683/m.354634 type:complete len:259 (-) Transcript_126683:596-1372(-)